MVIPYRYRYSFLGGYLAREVAREHPELVSDVITLGAPVVGGPKYTASAPMYLKKGYDLDAIEADVLERESVPIVVPVRAVYSRSDGVVAWRACVDRHNPSVTHHEVVSSHLGMVTVSDGLPPRRSSSGGTGF